MKLIILAVVSLALAFAQEQDKPRYIGGDVMKGHLASTVRPVYPPEAKRDWIQGTVKFDATIDKDGHVAELKLISGPPALVQSAMDAVKQWIYKPTLLNGEPIAVLTTIDVTYTME